MYRETASDRRKAQAKRVSEYWINKTAKANNMKSHYKIALPVQQVLTTLIAEAKLINGDLIIKSLTQQQPGGLPSIDHSAMLDNDGFRAAAIEQIEDQILKVKKLKEKFQCES